MIKHFTLCIKKLQNMTIYIMCQRHFSHIVKQPVFIQLNVFHSYQNKFISRPEGNRTRPFLSTNFDLFGSFHIPSRYMKESYKTDETDLKGRNNVTTRESKKRNIPVGIFLKKSALRSEGSPIFRKGIRQIRKGYLN